MASLTTWTNIASGSAAPATSKIHPTGLAGLVRSTAMPTSVVDTKATAVTVRATSSPLIGPRTARATDAAALSSPMARATGLLS